MTMPILTNHHNWLLFSTICFYFSITDVAGVSNGTLIENNCSLIRPNDPERPRNNTYIIGVLAFRGVDTAFADWNTTFNDYLTMTAGQKFDPPISFEMRPVSTATVFDDSLQMDFIFLNPSMYSCIESEYGASSLVSMINRRKVGGKIHDLTMFGGVILARADNDEVNTITDLQDKIVGVASIAGFGSGQMQFRAMQNAGLSHITAPKQLVFTKNQVKIVHGVMNGEFDVGFIRTDQLERTKDQDGNLVNTSLFKVIDPRAGLSIDGEPFPFESSTQLYPEWNLAAREHVPDDVSAEVQKAMLDLADHAKVGAAISQCQNDHNMNFCSTNRLPQEYNVEGRCDTTREIAETAYDAMTKGRFAGFRTTLSYMQIRSMQQKTGFISYDPVVDTWRCIRQTEIYDAITCPDGEYKKSKEDVSRGCSDAGLECTEGFLCLCSPCERPFVCHEGSVEINGRCFLHVYLMCAILVPVSIVIAFFVRRYVGLKKRQADSVWQVKSSELHFGDNPQVLGQGTFGVVLLAEYRGTQVAVKRVIPPVAKSNGDVPGQTSPDKEIFDFASSDASDDSRSNFDETVDDLESQSKSCDGNEEATSTTKDEQSLSRHTNSIDGAASSSLVLSWISKGSDGKKAIPKNEYIRLKSDFVKEMRQLSKLRHPCITTVMGAVISKRKEPMLVMEYMTHGSLYDLLHNDTMIIEGQIVFPILRDITQGLRFLHAAQPKVIHGDLKAQNILVDSKFRAKVADFGLSQKRTVGISGTPYWMAPELLRRETSNTTQSDMYSFGIILYEIYSRKEPYEGEDMQQVLHQVCDCRVNKRPPVPESCPPKIAELMTECLFSLAAARPSAEILDLRLKAMEVSNVEPMTKSRNSFTQRKDSINPLRRSKSKRIFYNIFPKHIAKALSAGRKIEPENHEIVSIFFSDIVGFTKISSSVSPLKVSSMLDRLYHAIDDLATDHGVFKIETVGDSYMGVTNLGGDQSNDHVKRIAEFAVDVLKAASNTLIDLDDPDRGHVELRTGFHSGPVVSNVIGSLNPKFGLFGDTVNTASRMESTSDIGKIHCSARSAKLLKSQAPHMLVSLRGEISVKGKGSMTTYWVTEAKFDSRQKYKSSLDLCIHSLE